MGVKTPKAASTFGALTRGCKSIRRIGSFEKSERGVDAPLCVPDAVEAVSLTRSASTFFALDLQVSSLRSSARLKIGPDGRTPSLGAS
jgi:hypothetical protein